MSDGTAGEVKRRPMIFFHFPSESQLSPRQVVFSHPGVLCSTVGFFSFFSFFFYSKVIFCHARGRLTSLPRWDFNWGRRGRRHEDVDRDGDLKGETRQREDSIFFFSLSLLNFFERLAQLQHSRAFAHFVIRAAEHQLPIPTWLASPPVSDELFLLDRLRRGGKRF